MLSKFGAGVVALNSDGQFVIACREANYESLEPELAEACALRRAVNLAREMGCDSVIFASDCLSLVQRINPLFVHTRWCCGLGDQRWHVEYSFFSGQVYSSAV